MVAAEEQVEKEVSAEESVAAKEKADLAAKMEEKNAL